MVVAVWGAKVRCDYGMRQVAHGIAVDGRRSCLADMSAATNLRHDMLAGVAEDAGEICKRFLKIKSS